MSLGRRTDTPSQCSSPLKDICQHKVRSKEVERMGVPLASGQISAIMRDKSLTDVERQARSQVALAYAGEQRQNAALQEAAATAAEFVSQHPRVIDSQGLDMWPLTSSSASYSPGSKRIQRAAIESDGLEGSMKIQISELFAQSQATPKLPSPIQHPELNLNHALATIHERRPHSSLAERARPTGIRICRSKVCTPQTYSQNTQNAFTTCWCNSIQLTLLNANTDTAG